MVRRYCEFSKEFERIFEKLQKKNKKQSDIIINKIREIIQNPEHYKPLSHTLKFHRRVHIDKSFVLVFKIEGSKLVIMDYDHHDNIYKKYR
ncbi:MAG TPA: type II toxin-antitoxin system mRNA interferase toxin, RelE/StbE family [archaeon]|nr:type II toxin-antitoxin system mRNA interferase toxin, RelE/StbE family [archaeon]